MGIPITTKQHSTCTRHMSNFTIFSHNYSDEMKAPCICSKTLPMQKANNRSHKCSTQHKRQLSLLWLQRNHCKTCKHCLLVQLRLKETLVAANAYSSPFEPLCISCNTPTTSLGSIDESTFHWAVCNKASSYIYSHKLNYTLFGAEGAKLRCTINNGIIKKKFPSLRAISHTQYMEDKENVVYLLRDFEIHATLTLNQNNTVTAIEKHTPTKP